MRTMSSPDLAESGFVDVICADEALLRAEFDAIVEAAWGGRSPVDDRPRHGDGSRDARDGSRRVPPNSRWSVRAVLLGRPRRQERSPPGSGAVVRPDDLDERR